MNVASRSLPDGSGSACADTAPLLRHNMHIPQQPTHLPSSARSPQFGISALLSGAACTAAICLPVLTSSAEAVLTSKAGATTQAAAPLQTVARATAPQEKPLLNKRTPDRFSSRITQRKGSRWINDLQALSSPPATARNTPQGATRVSRPEDFGPSSLTLRLNGPQSAVSLVQTRRNPGSIAKNKIAFAGQHDERQQRLARIEARRRAQPLEVVWLVNAAPKSPAATAAPAPATDKDQDLFRTKEFPGVGTMGKVIDVKALNLPSAAISPLTPEQKKAAIELDKPVANLPGAPVNRNNALEMRAQNPELPPIRQSEVPIANSDRLPNQLQVAVSTFVVLVTSTDLRTVAIADPAIADVAVINSRAALVNGKAPGITSLVIVDGLKIRQYQVRVTPALNMSIVDVSSAIGLEGVRVRQVLDTLILEGGVQNTDEMRRAVEIASIYSPKVINHLTLPPVIPTPVGPPAELVTAAKIQEAINMPRVTVRMIGDTALLDGAVDSLQQKMRAETIAKAITKDVVNVIQLPNLTVDQVRESVGGTAMLAPVAPAQDGTGGSVGMTGMPLPVSRIAVRQIGDQIVLEGTALTQAEIDQAATIAGRSGMQVINRLTVAAAASGEASFLNSVAAAIGQPGVRVRGTAVRLVLEGVVPHTAAAVAAEQIARGFSPNVDVLLMTPSPTLVNVDVSIVEISRNKLKTLGLNFPGLVETIAGFPSGQPIGGVGVGEGVGGTNLGTSFTANLRALIDSGNATLLSNPNTTVLSGRTTTFQVGGQVPIPASSLQTATGTTTAIEFKDFGVLVDVIPLSTPDGVTTMRVRTEVSQPDFTIGFTPFPGSAIIPGFTRRATVSEVTVAPNGTIALGGLIQTNINESLRKFPVISKFPIIGKLFQSKRFQRNETELVIFVTPRVLPNPLKPDELAPASPVAVGNTTNVATKLGNPGIGSFNTGSAIQTGGGGGGAR